MTGAFWLLGMEQLFPPIYGYLMLVSEKKK